MRSNLKIKISQDTLDFNRYMLETNEDIWDLLTFYYPQTSYNYAIKKWVKNTEEAYIADWNDEGEIRIYKGFAIYLYNVFYDYLDEESRSLLYHDIYMDSSTPNINYGRLRDDQIEITKELLKYRRSIVQIPTGSGKTEIIANLINELLKSGRTILVTTGVGKVIDEIKLRLLEYDSTMYLPDYWDSDSNINIIYPNGFARSNSYDESDPFWSRVDVVISDEVSGATSESSWCVYALISNKDCQWIGFDATAEKELGDRLDIRENLKCLHSMDSKWVIDLFGMSWMYKIPNDYEVDFIEVSNIGLREISYEMEETDFIEGATYRDIVNFIFSHREYLRTLNYVVNTYGKLFIPINNLEYINTVCELFMKTHHIGTITGEGYWSSKEGYITLERLKYLLEENEIKILLSSSSGFRGIDFRGIPNMLLTLGTKASQIIQMVGRVARQKHFRVITITPGNWKLPIYTKTNLKQLQILLDYYKDCRIKFKELVYE